MVESFRICFNDLPTDLTSRIFSLLPVEDILRCMTVCKDWYEQINDPSFFKLQFKTTALQHDRFIFINKWTGTIYLLDTEGKNVSEISLDTIFEGRERLRLSIMGSCHGFLCIASKIYKNPVLVCNPVTKEHVELPKSPPSPGLMRDAWGFRHAALGYDPSSAKYKVVNVHWNDRPGTSRGIIITLGETLWRPLDFPYKVLSDTNVLPIYCEGGLYWMIKEMVRDHTGNGFILFLNLHTEEFSIIRFPANMRLPRRYPPSPDNAQNWSLTRVGNEVIVSEYECSSAYLWFIRRNIDGEPSVRYFQFTCDVFWNWKGLSGRKFIGMLGDCHLLEGRMFESEEHFWVWNMFEMNYYYYWTTSMFREEKKDCHLLLYCPRRKLYLGAQVRGLPRQFRSLTLQPNLLSPPVSPISRASA